MTFLKMPVSLKTLVMLVVINTIFVATGISKSSENTMIGVLRVDEFGTLKLLRIPRETIVGNGCPKRRIWYYGKCKSFNELRDRDYDDITFTNEAETFKPETTVREDKFVETMETDINLSVVPLLRHDITTKLSTVMNKPEFTATKAIPDRKITDTVEKPRLPGTELKSIITKPTPELTALKPDVSDSSPAMTESSQSVAEKAKTVGTEPNHFLDGTGIKSDPTITNLGPTVTQQKFMVTYPILAMTESTTVAAEPTSVMTESSSAIIESRPTDKEPKRAVTEPNHILYKLSSTLVETRPINTETDPTVKKPVPTVTQQKFLVTNPRLVWSTSTFATTDLTLVELKTKPAMTDTVTTMDLTSAVLEISGAATETRSIVNKPKPIVKYPSMRDSTVTEPTPTATWTLSNLASELTSSLTGTRTTVTGNVRPTTAVQNKGIPYIDVHDDKVSYILVQVKSLMFTLILIVSGVTILNFIYEQL